MGLNLDFVRIAVVEHPRKKTLEITPKFIVGKKSNDLMTRGCDFYAVWDERKGMWSTDEDTVTQLVDQMIKDEMVKHNTEELKPDVKWMWDGDSGVIDKFHRYCQKQLRDHYHSLDEKIIFGNDPTNKKDYASKRLSYPIKEGPTRNWDKLMGVLYSPEELHKLEWAIGSVVTGDSKHLEKFFVLYGAGGTGKGTFLKVVKMMFQDYVAVFNAKALGQQNNSFALEPFSVNPLVAIDPDGKLDRIEDNTRLNTIVSHEEMTVNMKFKSIYSDQFKAMLFIGSNSPVKITDSRSGLIRRLIDVSPTGNTLKHDDYNRLWVKIPYELGAIAYKCRELYLKDPRYYDDYRPVSMMGTTNEFYNYILENADLFEEKDGTTLKQAWELYKTYSEDANMPYPLSRLKFKEELKSYFEEFLEKSHINGKQCRNVYRGFVIDKFKVVASEELDEENYILTMDQTTSLLDEVLKDCPAQYANDVGKPRFKWDNVRRKLSNVDTSKLHYVKVPENHIVIDFDLVDPNTGEKSYELNLEAASKFPPTYAELSKSGEGIHLHYIYAGDVSQLETIYAEHIEVKKFTGNASLRRKLTYCNDHPITTISSGLPVKKGDEKMIDFDGIKNEKAIRTMIRKNINKEYHDNTTQSMHYIQHILDEAYKSGISYDVSDMRQAVLSFAASSTNQSEHCLSLMSEMKWRSEDMIEAAKKKEPNIIFLDCEVVPNLFLVCWMPNDSDQVIRMFNPSPQEIEDLLNYDIVGHNVRGYDNHILYARMLGYDNESLWRLSNRIIDGDKTAKFSSAYSASYADTLDYPLKKQSLKRWEIDLKIPHQEFEMSFDKPLAESEWKKLADYCENDVRATKKVWEATQTDFKARQILATLANGTVNDTTNSLSTKFIFEGNKHPQSDFLYRDMGDISRIDDKVTARMIKNFPYEVDTDYTAFDKYGMPIFPGYTYEKGKSWYRDEDPKEGGYVYSEPGYHGNVALLDIASMHPSSIIAEQLFGEYYTKRFEDIVKTRLAIKHGDFDTVRKMFNGALAPFVEDESSAKDLANALKIVINSVYGLTRAGFDNPFKDKRNVDNIVAKRGALFMINLKHEVQNRGFKVAHIKTDSIKIPDATPEIISFVNAYGKMYGYTFEHEATYERLLLADRANYVAYDKEHEYWTATGDKYKRPFIFKPLFSHETLTHEDLCETKQVKTTIYLDLNESLPDVSAEEKELKKIETKYKKGEVNDTTFKKECDRLNPIIEKGHNRMFVGRVGSFMPVVPGAHGGICLRSTTTGTYGAVEGTKGYRWLESEYVENHDLWDQVDHQYFQDQLDKVIAESEILPGGDFEWFRNIDDPYVGPQYTVEGTPIYPDEVPFEV